MTIDDPMYNIISDLICKGESNQKIYSDMLNKTDITINYIENIRQKLIEQFGNVIMQNEKAILKNFEEAENQIFIALQIKFYNTLKNDITKKMFLEKIIKK